MSSEGGRRRGRRSQTARSGDDGREPLRELSYGGVVVRGDVAAGTAELAAIVPRGKRALALPKGGANPDEPPEATAVREVREETGLEVKPGESLGTIDYWFTLNGIRYHKQVFHWLMEAIGGDTAQHDHEFDEVAWMPLKEAYRVVNYENQRQVLGEAANALGVDL